MTLKAVRPSHLLVSRLIGRCMPSWFPWAVLACVLFVLPVLLRLLVGDDPPDNASTQEQGSEPGKRAEMRLAA